AMEAFIERAGESGLTIHGVLNEFLAVRVGGSKNTLGSLLEDGMSVANNYQIGIPAPPDPNFWQAPNLAAFHDRMAQFLGAPGLESRDTWGNGITVAVLDTGWLSHSAVANVRALDLVEGPADGPFAAHGTAVAGLIASNDAFAPGIAPGTEILS